jgi:hypothetical protein
MQEHSRLQLVTVESDLTPEPAGPQPTLGSQARPSQYLSCIATFPVGVPNLKDASSDANSLGLLTFDPTDVVEGERLDFLCCHRECPLARAFSMAASASAATDLSGVLAANLRAVGSLPLEPLIKACDCGPLISFSAAWKSV